MKPLTERQLTVLRRIQFFWDSEGYGPSIREMADRLGVESTYAVICHLRALRTRGLLTSAPKVARSIRLTPVGLAAIA